MGATHLTLDKLIVVVNWVEWVSSLPLASEGGSLFERVLDTWGSLPPLFSLLGRGRGNNSHSHSQSGEERGSNG